VSVSSDRLPLYEAKLIHQFDHRWATYADGSDREMTDPEKEDPSEAIQPRYWVEKADVAARVPADWPYEWFVGFRDITNATNERTTIASVVPYAGVGHTLPLIFAQDGYEILGLLGNLNCFSLDYIVRQKVGGTHLAYFILQQLPLLVPDTYGPEDMAFIGPRVLELVYTAWEFAPFARDMGYQGPPFHWDPERRAFLRAELDAYYASLYGLTREELQYILDPQTVMGPDFPSETFRVLKKNEERAFGEYRTQRLVLEAYDRLAANRGRHTEPAG